MGNSPWSHTVEPWSHPKEPASNWWSHSGNEPLQLRPNRNTPNRTLPDHFVGTFQLEKYSGFHKFMSEIGVSWFYRQIAYSLYPVETISQAEDGEITMYVATSLGS